MKGLSLVLLFACSTVVADEVRVQYRLTGLFQPDRVDDFRLQCGMLAVQQSSVVPLMKLVDVDYNAALVTFAYDNNAPPFKGRTPDQVREHLNQLLQHASRGSFALSTPSALEPAKLRKERIGVAGLDCKGCAYGAYRAVAYLGGVERAVVSFKEGHVTVWINPAKTNRQALVAALQAAQVDVTKPDPISQRENRPASARKN